MFRSPCERLFQTLLFEAGGLLLTIPLYQAIFGDRGQSPAVLMVTLSLTVMLWSPLHNALFDRLDRWCSGRTASQRPQHLRLIHALSHELTPIIVTLPLVMLIGQHSMAEAVAVNSGLTVLYVGYAYLFYLLYDGVRPMRGANHD